MIGPFDMVRVMLHGVVVFQALGSDEKLLVNVQRVKHYWGGDIDRHKTLVDISDV